MNTAIIILAAGLGKRMRSSLPKVLHRTCGVPMLRNVVTTVKKLGPEKIIVVAGKYRDLIQKTLDDEAVTYALQQEPKGTGHAVLCARPALKGFSGDILILNGDTPLVGDATLKKFLRIHRKDRNDVSLLSFIARNPAGYGRVMREKKRITAIREEKGCGAAEKAITEVNSGVYALRHNALAILEGSSPNASTGEYYLTDIVECAVAKGMRVSAYPFGKEEEFMGVNTRGELLKASEIMRSRIIDGLTARGVTFLNPEAVLIHPEVFIGQDTVIYPNVCLEGESRIGPGAVIYPNVRITGSKIGNGAVIKDSTVIENSVVGDKAVVGPFAHIRPGTEIGSEAKIGNFVELKKTIMGKGSKASHLSYLGDALIGNNVNIGAGTITCNYDGLEKHRTIIRDNVFVGSDSQLVAPVEIGKDAFIGAGSTITSDVPSEALAVSRVAQKNIPGWAKKRARLSRLKKNRKKIE